MARAFPRGRRARSTSRPLRFRGLRIRRSNLPSTARGGFEPEISGCSPVGEWSSSGRRSTSVRAADDGSARNSGGRGPGMPGGRRAAAARSRILRSDGGKRRTPTGTSADRGARHLAKCLRPSQGPRRVVRVVGAIPRGRGRQGGPGGGPRLARAVLNRRVIQATPGECAAGSDPFYLFGPGAPQGGRQRTGKTPRTPAGGPESPITYKCNRSAEALADCPSRPGGGGHDL